ncbi:MAG TPA: hypothetical protein VFR58_06005 [Flavisolibacter sp.]|nr:hypothetical protein [Flavisolibacter sp.]
MSPRSLFSIVLKITGIFFIKDMLVATPQLVSSFLFLIRSTGFPENAWVLITTLITLAIYGLVIVYLVLKTDWVIDKL